MNLGKIKLKNLLIGAVGTSAVIAGANNLTAENPDLSSIEQSTSIQYQVPENSSQSQKDCYKIMSEVSLSQFSAFKSKEEGHKRAMKKCGINP